MCLSTLILNLKKRLYRRKVNTAGAQILQGCAADVLEINMDDDLGCVLSTKYRAAFQAVKYALKEMATSSCRLPAVKPSDTGGILKYNNAVEDLFSKLTVPEHHMLYLFVLCIYFDVFILI